MKEGDDLAEKGELIKRKKGTHTRMGIASLVSGIVSCFVLPIIFGPLALILGDTAWKRDKDSYGVAGAILGVIGFTIWFFILII